MSSRIAEPFAKDKAHIRLSYITHFYCNQNDIAAVTALLRSYEKYDAALLDVVEFVIVDDGSPMKYEIPEVDLNITWLRIKEDIPWNQAGARNLGVTYAASDRIVMTDLDHFFPEETLRYMAYRRHPGRSFFKIYRTNAETGALQKGHSNIFYMSRARFMRFFGYDEEFAGHYGAEDYRFVKYHKYHGSVQRYLPKKYRCFERVLDRRKSYHSLERDLSFNTPIDKRKEIEIEKHGHDYGHSRLFLNFSWEIALRRSRATPARRIDRRWKLLWWGRYLLGYFSR